MGAGLTKSQKIYYERKALINLQKEAGGSIKGGQLHFKKGWVTPDWLVASNAEMALNLKAVKRDKFKTIFGKRVQGIAKTGIVVDSLSNHYWNKSSFIKNLKQLKR
jgi:hypothetical protein